MNKEELTKKIVSKERLLHITDLNSETINQMDDEQLHNYTAALASAVNIFPIHKNKLEATFQQMDYAPMLQWLKALKNTLSKIHADNLARDCEKQLNINQDLDHIRHERLRVFLDYFLSNLTMLFADIQQMFEDLEMAAFEQKSFEHNQEAWHEKVKEKLSTIAELNAAKIDQMTYDQLDSYVEILNVFLEDFPAEDKGLRGALNTRDYSSVLQWLESIKVALSQIHADNLMEDCQHQIELMEDLSAIRHEKLEVFVNYFLTSLSLLASDIQAIKPPKQEHTVIDTPKESAKEPNIAKIESPIKLLSNDNPSSKVIFAIDKMRIFLENLKVSIDGAGHKLVGATSSKVMFEYLKTAKPDLFILDDGLPEMDGYALAKRIREMGQTAPIIFLTSNITKEYMIKAMSAGVADFIVKPITSKNVREKISKYLT